MIGKHPRGRTVAAGVVPGFMPKHNSEPIAAGGSTGFDATLLRLAIGRSLVAAGAGPCIRSGWGAAGRAAAPAPSADEEVFLGSLHPTGCGGGCGD